ncbi:RING finger protein 11-like isoform X1 [Ischnura elegans]|uniref:RING finger protein 11-like isoform X1 n=1 Tax=Ischnura elegans TaxID=197161 RepID=UPI001ED88EB1|nr:RING finger protein 11-like isoform X1 [Ischnura elegans]
MKMTTIWSELPCGSPSPNFPPESLPESPPETDTTIHYELLNCDYIIKPNLIPPCSLESHGDYRGYKAETAPVYYPSPNVSRTATQLTEEEQVKIAKRIGLIQHLPTGTYDGCKKNRECVICMIEFMIGDAVRYLPCMHTYHVDCIDDWLMRSFTCPSCMEPVDAALLTTYETN